MSLARYKVSGVDSVLPRSPLVVHVKRRSPTPTKVFDSYWTFAAERQLIYLRRVFDAPAPWTRDPVLREYKFTNVYRAADRVSQYLIRNVIYAGGVDARDMFLRVLLFKLFNKLETWEAIESELGRIEERSFSIQACDRVLEDRMRQRIPIYSAAYIMPSAPIGAGTSRKHRTHLELVHHALKVGVADRVMSARSMEAAYNELVALDGIGPFLAYQFIIDLNYSAHLKFSEMDFVVPGPGARDGIHKCFADLGDYTPTDVIRWVADNQEREFQRRGIHFESLWGRPLQLIDCQNLFCEIDKYARVVHPTITGVSGRTRIKQRFTPAARLLPPWFPPKWGVNPAVEASIARQQRSACRSAVG